MQLDANDPASWAETVLQEASIQGSEQINALARLWRYRTHAPGWYCQRFMGRYTMHHRLHPDYYTCYQAADCWRQAAAHARSACIRWYLDLPERK